VDKIKIITDSTVDLPKGLIEKYNIEVLPLIVAFGDESYLDGIDINFTELIEKMDKGDIFPTTSQINPVRFSEVYKKYLKEGYKILSIHISSKMSGTFQSACIARDMLETKDVVVIDSLNVTSGLGLLVLKACGLKEDGRDLNFIEEEINRTIPHVKSALAFESLDNLVKGGRLSKTVGVIGSVLGIRLILEVNNGEMAVMDKVRGTKKAIRTVLDYIEEKGIKQREPCIVLNAENQEIVEALRENMLDKKQEFVEAEVGCVVGTHSGTGAAGVFFIEEY
jgi:DegV family protein with EDD domain